MKLISLAVLFLLSLLPTQALAYPTVVVQSVEVSVPAESSGYVRDTEWLTMPTITNTDEVLNGLVAVNDGENNYLAFSVTGAYTVDWGDGSATESFASGVVAEHNFAFANLGVETTHTEGYRQAIVSVTMQTPGTMTAIDLDERHSGVGNERWQLGWMDVEISGPSITSFALQSNEAPMLLLKEFSILSNSITSFSNMFNNCYSLQSIPLLDTSAGTSFSSMFRYCSSLQSIPLLDTSAGTSFSSMFFNCYSLQAIPLLDTSACTNFSYMFYYCSSLQSIPLLDTSAGTSFYRMFSYCYSLQGIPLLDTSASTNLSDMFYSCSSLQVGAMSGTALSIKYHSAYLTTGAIVDIFNGLASVSGQTITITGNIGVSGLSAADRLIATDKGWVIVDA